MEVRDRILLGSRELFFQYGVKSITMDDVAKHLSISKKTIYQFFKDKDELVLSVAQQHFDEVNQELNTIAETANDPIDEFLKLSEHFKLTLQNLSASVLYDIQKFYPGAWQIFTDHKEQCISCSVKRNLEAGIEKGLYRPDIDVNILSILRMEQIIMGFNSAVFPIQKFEMQKVQLQMLEHFLYGICTMKGHKLINKYKQITEED